MFRIDKRHVKIAGPEGLAAADASAAPALPGILSDSPSPAAAPADASAASASSRAERVMAEADEQAGRILAQAEHEAAELLAEAGRQAGEILAEARRQAEQEALEIRGQGWQAGHQEGVRAGREEALEEGRRQAAELEVLIDGLRQGWEERVAHLEDETVGLALAIARKVINTAIRRDDEMHKSLIENALNQMKREGKLLIRLSSGDFARLFPSGSAVFTLGDRTVTAQVTADPDMKDGDCALESDAETLDAGVESQLAAITVAFEQAGKGGPQ